MKMVDLNGQYERLKAEIDEVVEKVLASGAYIKGTEVTEFQENLSRFLSIPHVIGCGSGTDALQIALMALGLQPGDEVITTPFTFIATAEVMALLRVQPVFVDVEENTFNLDIHQINAAITPRTKAILPVHLYGQSANMDPLLQIAEKHGLYVVEDACQSIGAEYIFADGQRNLRLHLLFPHQEFGLLWRWRCDVHARCRIGEIGRLHSQPRCRDKVPS